MVVYVLVYYLVVSWEPARHVNPPRVFISIATAAAAAAAAEGHQEGCCCSSSSSTVHTCEPASCVIARDPSRLSLFLLSARPNNIGETTRAPLRVLEYTGGCFSSTPFIIVFLKCWKPLKYAKLFTVLYIYCSLLILCLYRVH